MKPTQQAKATPSSHFLRNLIIIFLSALLVLGTVLGTISIIRGKNTYARYSGVIADRGTYSYLLSYYKFNHMRALAGVEGVEDTEAFWNSLDAESGKTQGELLSEGAKNYISRVLISAALFDSAATAAQKKAAKQAAKKAAEEILEFRAEGDVQAFNEATAPFGYAYKDLETIALLLYKAENAQSLFYGISGETVTTRLNECNIYLKENYSAVYLLFIRTENTFSITENDDGTITKDVDENGEYIMRALLDEEISKRETTIAVLDAAIEKGTLTKAYFESTMQDHYKNAPEGTSTLYYFADGADYTERFAAAISPDIVTAAKELAVGKCQKVTYADGYCYVFKSETADNVFTDSQYADCFSDFKVNVSSYLFSEDIATYRDDVVFKDRAAEISITNLPYKNFIAVRF